jgi:hypothetical protein
MLCPILLQAAIKRPRATKVEIGGRAVAAVALEAGSRRGDAFVSGNEWTTALTLSRLSSFVSQN